MEPVPAGHRGDADPVRPGIPLATRKPQVLDVQRKKRGGYDYLQEDLRAEYWKTSWWIPGM